MHATANGYQKNEKVIAAIIAVVTVVVVATVVVAVLYFWHKNDLTTQVKNDLNKVVASMESNHSKLGAYPSVIPTINDKNVQLSGDISFDGTSYCINGISKSDKSISFYIESKYSSIIKSGTCTTGSDIPAPSIPGGLATAFITISSVNLIWDSTPYATSYTMQCSTDNQFKSNITSIKTTIAAGVCKKLQANTTYYCRVKATNKKGDSAWSTIIIATMSNV